MGVKKNRLKRGLVLALTLALVGNGMSQSMLTALAKEDDPTVETIETKDVQKEWNANQSESKAEGDLKGAETNSGETKEGEQTDKSTEINDTSKQAETDMICEELYLGKTETSAETISLFSLDASGKVALTAGNHERWIDRIDVPDYAKNLYNMLVEGSDNDGIDDILIDDKYYSEANTENILTASNSKYSVIPVTTITGDNFITDEQWKEIGKYVRAVYDAFDRDHPEVFWLTGSNLITYTGRSANGKIQSDVYFILKNHTSGFDVRKDNYQSAAAIKADISVRDQKVQTILDSAPAGSTFDKVTYFNEWLTKNNQYNTNVSGGADAYAAAWECMSALKGSVGEEGPVCEGYARAFKVLCDKAGIPCVLADGHAKNSASSLGEAHMWNNVKVDGSWYGIDVTWNDPTGGNSGAVSGYEDTSWSLVGTKTEIGGMNFEDSHPAVNTASQNGASFTNGPVLSETAYVKKEVPVISFASESITTTYNGMEAEITAPEVMLNGSKIIDATITYSYKASDDTEFKSGWPINAGTYTLKASVAATDTYGAAEAETELVIKKRTVVIKANDQNIIYGASLGTGVDKVSSTSIANGDLISNVVLSSEGKDVGNHAIKPSGAVIKRSDANVTDNYEITYQDGKLTINPTSTYTDNTEESQNILSGIGTFTQPAFTGVGGETVEGTISYSYNDKSYENYNALVTELAKLEADDTGNIKYIFTPKVDGNYTGLKSGEIKFTIKDIEFVVGNDAATTGNAVTLKKDSVYGDRWSEIVKINTITAKVGDKTDGNPDHFSLKVDGGDIPTAGAHTFQIVYNGELGDRTYVDSVVCTGTVNVTQRALTVSAGSYSISKVYDGTTVAGTASGQLSVNGILTGDTGVIVTVTPAEYMSADVGRQENMELDLVLGGLKSENYKLNNAKVTVPCKITPRQIVPSVNVTGSYAYTGEEVIPEVIVTDGQTVLLDYEMSCRDNVNAGLGKVTVSPKQGGNYTWTPVEVSFVIAKADYKGKQSASQSTKYGNADTYNLASLLPDGAKLGNLIVEDSNGIFKTAPSINGTVLSYELTADGTKVEQTATITVPVTETTNYKSFSITVTITVSAKLVQDNFKFDVTDVKKVYGDGDFAVVAANAAEGSIVTYISSEPTVATVDGNGNVHILRKGTATVTATASETKDYVGKSVTYTLTISPKALTWDVSELQAVDRLGKEDKNATLFGLLKVSGIVSSDTEKVIFDCPAEKLMGTYDEITAGPQKVTLAWADEAVCLTGTDADNYTLPSTLPEITGRINAVSEQPNVPESTDTVKYKLEVEDGISQVPEALKDIPELNTPAKIEEKMKYEIKARLMSESNQNSVKVYDVVLMVKDGDKDWVPATPENFPEGGITVTLPYPEGTGKDTHNFEIAHMFTIEINNHKPGEIEYPTPTKSDEGIQFKVTSLSPIGIGWKEIKKDNPTVSGNSANKTNTNASKKTSPQTGDENTIMLYVLLMMLGAAGVGFTMKRKAMR